MSENNLDTRQSFGVKERISGFFRGIFKKVVPVEVQDRSTLRAASDAFWNEEYQSALESARQVQNVQKRDDAFLRYADHLINCMDYDVTTERSKFVMEWARIYLAEVSEESKQFAEKLVAKIELKIVAFNSDPRISHEEHRQRKLNFLQQEVERVINDETLSPKVKDLTLGGIAREMLDWGFYEEAETLITANVTDVKQRDTFYYHYANRILSDGRKSASGSELPTSNWDEVVAVVKKASPESQDYIWLQLTTYSYLPLTSLQLETLLKEVSSQEVKDKIRSAYFLGAARVVKSSRTDVVAPETIAQRLEKAKSIADNFESDEVRVNSILAALNQKINSFIFDQQIIFGLIDMESNDELKDQLRLLVVVALTEVRKAVDYWEKKNQREVLGQAELLAHSVIESIQSPTIKDDAQRQIKRNTFKHS